ncbi:hypothetical protein [Streptomyces sp. NPDC056194]|uniref:hypothetical protein n=1 Tax=unclassified Streptomyces TaxID=2593676 RepID=UPI0035E10BC4
MATVIPGPLADHLTRQTIADAETVAVLDAARRGRGRTLVIEPTSTRVLHVISAYAEAILENRGLHTAAEARAARLWMQRAGHTPASFVTPADVEQEQAPRDVPSDWWTITDPGTGKEVARVYGETYQEMTPRAEALPEVRAVIRRHRGFSRRRLYVSELTADQLAQQHEQEQQRAAARLDAVEEQAAAEFAATTHAADAVEYVEQVEAGVATVVEAVALYDVHLAADPLVDDELRHAAALVTEAEATEGTWRGQWIGDTPADAILFVADRTVEQGALFDDRATT